jgi:hypothetical protein
LKLYTSDQTELMEVSALRAEGGALVVAGTIMGAMPIEAHLTPSELRKALGLLNPKLVLFILRMLFRT